MSKLSPQRPYSERVLCPTQHKKMLSPREVGPQVNGSSTCVAFQTMPATLQITLVKARKTNIISCYLCLKIFTLTAFIIFGIGNQKKMKQQQYLNLCINICKTTQPFSGSAQPSSFKVRHLFSLPVSSSPGNHSNLFVVQFQDTLREHSTQQHSPFHLHTSVCNYGCGASFFIGKTLTFTCTNSQKRHSNSSKISNIPHRWIISPHWHG